jgi:Uma2 family endonuclease
MTVATPQPASRQQALRLDAVSWSQYERIGHLFQDRPLRITFDNGRLEIMTTSAAHERHSRKIALLILVLVEELGLQMAGFGSMTFKQKPAKKGLEPDECFWIQNAAAVRSKNEIDLAKDPPPDLVLEVEISRSTLDRMSIYSALGVPEVWRCTTNNARVCHLVNGDYMEEYRSVAFPSLHPQALLNFLRRYPDLDDIGLMRQFRTWVRKQIANGWRDGCVKK